MRGCVRDILLRACGSRLSIQSAVSTVRIIVILVTVVDVGNVHEDVFTMFTRTRSIVFIFNTLSAKIIKIILLHHPFLHCLWRPRRAHDAREDTSTRRQRGARPRATIRTPLQGNATRTTSRLKQTSR